MLNFLIGFITATALIVIYIIYISDEYLKTHNKIFSRLIIEDYSPKSGDIIYLIMPFYYPSINLATDGYFQHYSIIVEKDGQYYTFDMARENQFYRGSPAGMQLNPLSLMNHGNRLYFVAQRRQELSKKDNDKILNLLNSGYKYPPDLELFQGWLLNKRTNVDDERQNCVDMMAIILYTIGQVDILNLPLCEKVKFLENEFGQIKQLV